MSGPQVPAAKKAIERFLYVLRQFYVDNNLSDAISTGKLKHKGADGHTQPSQLFSQHTQFETPEDGEGSGDENEDEGSDDESEGEGEGEDGSPLTSSSF